MNTIFKIINESTLTNKSKAELTLLVDQFVQTYDSETEAVAEMYKSKAGLNERQYSKRLSQAVLDKERNDILIEQFAYRNWFVNTVLRIRELRLRLEALSSQIAGKIRHLSQHSEVCIQLVAIALTRLVSDKDFTDASKILRELDNASDVSRERLTEAVLKIFESKRTGQGIFARRNFSSTILNIFNPSEEQTQLTQSVQLAMTIRAQLEELYSEFLDARQKCNLPQFTQRIEQAHSKGDSQNVRAIRIEKANAEARLYIAAVRYELAYKENLSIQTTLYNAILDAASAIQDQTSIEGLKAISHCIGAWHWLGELTGYLKEKYLSCKPANELNKLDFDIKAYIGE